MSERTGLGPLEVALLRSAKATAQNATAQNATAQDTTAQPSFTKTTTVLDHLETVEHYGPSYGVHALQDLGVPWIVHLRLFDLEGNWGSAYGDPMADPQYTRLRLSSLGELALAAERGETGPVPVDLVNGSAYRGGERPALAPRATITMVEALVRGETPPTPPYDELLTVPTGGTVQGDLAALLGGRRTRVELSCRIEREPSSQGTLLVITGTPPGVLVDEIEHSVQSRIRAATWPGRRDYLPEKPAPEPLLCTEVRDETTYRTGTRILVMLASGADPDEAEAWLRSIWPVTVTTDRQIPGGLERTLRDWADRCREDPSGLEGLSRLLG